MPTPLTLTNGLLFARELYIDTDTNSEGASDAELTRIANSHIHALHELVGPRLSWLNATACNGTVNLSGNSLFLTTQTDIDEIVGACREVDASSTVGTPLIKEQDFQSFLRLRQQGGAVNDFANTWSAFRVAADPSSASLGKWSVWTWPHNVTDSYISLIVRRAATELASGSDVPDLTPSETYSMWRLVAADAAFMIGNDHLVDRILAPIPQRIMQHYRVEARAVRPRHGEHLVG